MKLADRDNCTGCSACFAVCPHDAISMQRDEEGFLQPVVDGRVCVKCGLCEKVCPALRNLQKDENPKCFALRIDNRDILMSSTSGGAFSAIANPILESKGCVFGCVIKYPDLYVFHTKAASVEELALMRGSKYVQSDLRNTFRECKKELDKGRRVLFSGTSCQIAGLNAFLGKQYDNLTTVDLICHGVPSPGVFEKYKLESEQREKSKIKSIVFRHKDVERRFSLALSFVNAREKRSYVKYDRTFFNAFINDLCLRNSCYGCRFREGRGGSDFTIADFWQVEKCGVGLEYGEEGVSLVIAHTNKAKTFMKGYIEVPFKDALRGNPSYFNAPALTDKRHRFFHLIRNRTVGAATRQILEGIFFVRILKCSMRKVKSSVKSLIKQ